MHSIYGEKLLQFHLKQKYGENKNANKIKRNREKKGEKGEREKVSKHGKQGGIRYFKSTDKKLLAV